VSRYAAEERSGSLSFEAALGKASRRTNGHESELRQYSEMMRPAQRAEQVDIQPEPRVDEGS
jgi:hypothetical protein